MHKTLTILATLLWTIPILGQNGNQYIDASMPVYYTPGSFSVPPGPGDTIFIASDRTEGLIFRFLEGSIDEPIVIINDGGQVNINTTRHSAIDFRDCKHIKMTGRGSSAHHYGFKLDAFKCGVAFSGFSSHCEIEFVEIDHDGFFGIKAKKDFGGNPPLPISVFSHLIIHDNLIKNVTEGMYIGEYKTPAMEFKHLRVFNNVIQDTGREGIQITNASEDVAVYNNFIWNAGTDHKKFHGKSLQIGDNCVGRYYNNVMIGAIIIFGSGDIEITNNYCSESEGGSIDNRKVSFEDAPIIVADNYFHDLTLNQVVRNRNEINYIELTDNEWHGGSPSMFYNNQSGAQQKSVLQNNTNVPVTIIANPDLSVPYPQFPAPYQDLGPQQGLSYTINYLPQLEIEEVHMIDWDQPDTLEFNAYVQDGDGIQYEFSGLPSFIQVELVGDGTARLIAQPATTDKGVYPIKVVVSDDSHNDKTRLSFDYIVKTQIILHLKSNLVIICSYLP